MVSEQTEVPIMVSPRLPGGTRADPGAALRDERWRLFWDVEAQDAALGGPLAKVGLTQLSSFFVQASENKQKSYFAEGCVHGAF